MFYLVVACDLWAFEPAGPLVRTPAHQRVFRRKALTVIGKLEVFLLVSIPHRALSRFEWPRAGTLNSPRQGQFPVMVEPTNGYSEPRSSTAIWARAHSRAP